MLPSASIKPSEMCGMESTMELYGRAEVIPVRRASAVRIVTKARPQSTIITRTRTSMDQASPVHGHRHNHSLDSHNHDAQVAKNDTPTSPISLGALVEQSRPPSSTNASFASQDSRKRDTMLDFFSRRGSVGQAPKQRQKLVKLNRSASKRISSEQQPVDDRKDSMQPVTLDQYGAGEMIAPPSPRARNPTRPSFSTLNGPREPKMTVGSISSRPLSMAVQKSPISQWTPSSSSSDADSMPHSQHKRAATTTYIDVSTLRYDASDVFDSTDDSSFSDNNFMADVVPTPAYMNKDDLDSSSDYGSRSLDAVPQLASHAGHRTAWFDERESDELPEVSSPTSTIRPQSSLIYWSPVKEARMSMIQHSTAEQSEEENWPLPAMSSELRPLEESDEQVLQHDMARLDEQGVPHYLAHNEQDLPRDMARDEQSVPHDMARIISHFSTKSQDTTSSGSTVMSPTFDYDLGRTTTADSTPVVSPVIDSRQQMSPMIDTRQQMSPVIDTRQHMAQVDDTPRHSLRSNIQDDTASIAQSDTSTQWKLTAKERLGLGGTVRKAKSKAIPWEDVTPTPRKQKPAKSEPKRSSSSRFSSFMKWRNQALDDIYTQEMHRVNAERAGRTLPTYSS